MAALIPANVNQLRSDAESDVHTPSNISDRSSVEPPKQDHLGQPPGLLENERGRQQFVGSSSWEAITADTTNVAGDEGKESEAFREPAAFPFAMKPSFNTSIFDSLFSESQKRPLIDHLLNHFFENVHPFWAIFHRPTFMRRISLYMDIANPSESGPQKMSLSTKALFSSVLMLSASCMTEEQGRLLSNFGWDSSSTDLARILRDTTEQCLVADDFLREYSLDNTQALLLLHVTEIIGARRLLSAFPLYGIIIRLAQSIGLYR